MIHDDVWNVEIYRLHKELGIKNINFSWNEKIKAETLDNKQ